MNSRSVRNSLAHGFVRGGFEDWDGGFKDTGGEFEGRKGEERAYQTNIITPGRYQS